MHVFKVLFIILEVVLLFNLLILVHELGHFLAARWRGLKVDRFAIWFGKPLWQKKVDGVVYCLGSIPAGGYVALPQMAPMEAIEGKSDSDIEDLPPITPLDKIIVAAAGPLFSFLLAFVFAVIVWGIGRPVGEADTTAVVGYVVADGPAAQAGVQVGDRILKVDGYPVNRFGGMGESVKWRVVSSEGDTIPLEIERDGKDLTLESGWTKEETSWRERDGLREIGILPWKTPLIARVKENSPASRAGLQPNDIILEANGVRLGVPQALGDLIAEQGPGKAIDLKIERKGKVLDVKVTPEMPVYADDYPKDERVPMIGVVWDLKGLWTVDHPRPYAQIKMSVMAMVNTFSALFSSGSDVKAQHLVGPVGIMRIYYILFESEQGWRQAIWFSVILNVNLALLNLLPLPVLDGGHITLACIEAIRGRPVGARFLGWVQSAFAILLIGYMVYITFFDIQDLPWGGSDTGPPEPTFAPSADKAGDAQPGE